MTLAPAVRRRPPAAPETPISAGIWSSLLARVLVDVGWLVVALGVMAALWQAAVTSFGLDAFGTKSPLDVLHFLTRGEGAAENRAQLWLALRQTGGHAGSGFVVGMVVGAGLAVLFVLAPALERPLMPAVLLTQALPILAILPLFVLIFGRGLTVTLVITTLAVFFTTFVLTLQGLRSVPADQIGYLRSLDASGRFTLFRIRLPYSVPSLFAAAKVAVPAAMFGAILAEWLATGNGLGYVMITATAGAGSFSLLWAAVAVTTVVTMASYTVVGVVEALCLAHFAPERLGQRRR